jgi:Nucleotidyl transferase AbiEii toxin, Type IV TA system
MENREPQQPNDLDPLAAQVLEQLTNQGAAGILILGGYFALKHYLNYRQTKDIDAWWSKSSSLIERQEAVQLLRQAMTQVGADNGLELQERSSATTLSLELKQGRTVIFSVQIADRDVEIDPPVVSPYPPVHIETLRDNIGAKMNALVNRGAPRDFVDVYAIVTEGIATVTEIWQCWQQKNERLDITTARLQVLRHINAIEQRRPIEQIPGDQREQAMYVRRWIRQQLLELPEPERGIDR